jgi:hypothetical protein
MEPIEIVKMGFGVLDYISPKIIIYNLSNSWSSAVGVYINLLTMNKNEIGKTSLSRSQQ